MSSIPKRLLFSIAMAAVLITVQAQFSHGQDNVESEEVEFRTCSQSMEITDVRFSARAKIGVEVIFDDIGCAVIWRNLQCALDQATFDAKATVRDFNNLSSVLMSKAIYVLNRNLKTPIGFGLAAFRDTRSAKAFIRAKGSGKLMTYKEIIILDLRPPEPPEDDSERKK
jgi:hypothetical protein